MARLLTLLVMLVLWTHAGEAAWHRAETDHFVILADAEADVVRRHAVELESLDRAMRALTGLSPEPSLVKLRIFVVENDRAVADYIGNRDAAGFYNGSMDGPYAVVPRRDVGTGDWEMSARHVLFHEYAHHFMYQYAPSSYPGWYVEGFAELFATAELRDDGRVLIGRPLPARVGSYQLSRRLRFADILTNAVTEDELIYAQGWMLVHYAAFDPVAARLLARYLAALTEGSTPAEAYAETFARLEGSLDGRLRDYGLGRRLPAIAKAIEPVDVSSIAVTAVSDREAEIAMLAPRNPDRMQAEVARLADRYPGSPQLHLELARSFSAAGDAQRALREVDRALQLAPDDVRANTMQGDLILARVATRGSEAEADRALAREHYLRANRQDPRNARALHGYFTSFPDLAALPEAAVSALESAFALVPQNGHLRLDLARVYISRGAYDRALDAILPVLQGPHIQRDAYAEALADTARRGLAGETVTVPEPGRAENETD